MTIETDQMRHRDFDIVNDAQKGYTPVDGICQFKYKGYKISISTAGRSKGACQSGVFVFDDKNEYLTKDGFNTVQEAIAYVDNFCTLKTNAIPFIFARCSKESQEQYEDGTTIQLKIVDWVVKIAAPDFKVYNSSWMDDKELGRYCLVPDVDIQVEDDMVFKTMREAIDAIAQWWSNSR